MNQDKKKVQVKMDQTQEAGVYSNAVSVHVNKNEMVLDFGYIIPNVKPTTIKVASRVNISHNTAESFLKILSNAVLDLKNKKSEQATQNDPKQS
ncbi:DUF3467 domain-containing protein [Candidatus Peregrinibacteria bacterium]|nr:DUF3467 domain-containing protein [Candidatus Peregrinibacteria bacterium]